MRKGSPRPVWSLVEARQQKAAAPVTILGFPEMCLIRGCRVVALSRKLEQDEGCSDRGSARSHLCCRQACCSLAGLRNLARSIVLEGLWETYTA